MVVDLDGDGAFEVLMSTVHGDVAAWTFEESGPECEALTGWPVHVYDSAFTPRATNEGLLVSSGATYVHYFQYPDGGAADANGWGGYGNDNYNSGLHLGCEGSLRTTLGELTALSKPLQIGPVPSSGSQRVLILLQDDSRDVDLAVYDVQGRRVRQIVSGALSKGAHSLSWSGLDDGSHRVASGVYFYQLKIDGHVRETIRTVVLR